MSEAQTLARDLYSQNPSISSADLAEACGKTRRWATGELQKLRGAISQSQSERPKEDRPKTVRKPKAKPAESRTASPVSIPTAQPAGALLVTWVAFGAGLLASIAANIMSAGGGFGPRAAAAFAPVALLLSVEVLARTRWRKAGTRWKALKYGGLTVIAAVTAVVSYGHQRHLLLGYGESTLNATILPLAVDGLLTVAAAALIAMKTEEA